jgi:putative Mn2+ efflux pump MntP
MSFFTILLIALSLAMDAFAVALSAGTSGHGHRLRPAARLAFHFGLFQFLMPVLGWYLGTGLARRIQQFDHWVAFALLAAVGGHMLFEAFRRTADELPADPTRGLRLVTLSVATSLDALAVGLSLAMLGVQIWYPSVVIGVVTAALSLLGVQLGTRLREGLGKRMEFVGGVVLILIGVHIVISHTR